MGRVTAALNKSLNIYVAVCRAVGLRLYLPPSVLLYCLHFHDDIESMHWVSYSLSPVSPH